MTGAGPERLSSLLAGLADLALPGGCAGCGGAAGLPLRYAMCETCRAAVAGLRPHPTRPDPAPDGLPPCAALGDYDGVLRELVLGYKDRGRHRLARPLGRLLADVVASLVPGPAVLVPVPDTKTMPEFLTAYCGLRIAPGFGEVLPAAVGMPCESCLAHSTLPVFSMLRQFHGRIDRQ